ncbi:electron transport complex subunit RsxB [Methyloprofundus sp.]|uniref:electron transport complex subunit RsxB n=1 Tax=Methyloprofundus sp. TaxID=2020875 RepID=UPI003D11E586
MLVLSVLFALLGLGLGFAARYLKVQGDPLVEQIDALLPQTQCGQCKYPGCRPYAEAVASGVADINQCPPGGEEGVAALANLLGVVAKPLNADFGKPAAPAVAFIIEQDCIGCVKCIPPCPVDAILGASKQMHTVITAECTGCELCIAPCPVDCIIMQPLENSPGLWQWKSADD